MLGVVQSNLKMVKLFMQHLWMSHDVVVVWPGSCALGLQLQHQKDALSPSNPQWSVILFERITLQFVHLLV